MLFLKKRQRKLPVSNSPKRDNSLYLAQVIHNRAIEVADKKNRYGYKNLEHIRVYMAYIHVNMFAASIAYPKVLGTGTRDTVFSNTINHIAGYMHKRGLKQEYAANVSNQLFDDYYLYSNVAEINTEDGYDLVIDAALSILLGSNSREDMKYIIGNYILFFSEFFATTQIVQ